MNPNTIKWLESKVEQNILSKIMVEQLFELIESTEDAETLDYYYDFITQLVNEYGGKYYA